MIVENKKNTKIRNIIIIIVIILSLALVSFFIFTKIYKNSTNNSTTKTPNDTNKVIIDNNPATSEQIIDGNNTKTKTGDESSNNAKNDTNTTNVNLTITSANQNNTLLQVRTMIDAVDNSGLCTISITNGNKVINKTANVQAQASISTCLGFDIPLSELSAGTWKITVSYQNNTVSGSASTDIVIK